MPKKVDHAQRQIEITDAAVSAIAERGLDDLRLVDVAREMGATTGSIIHYFPDKDALLLAAMERVIEGIIDDIARPREADSFISGAQSILPRDSERLQDWSVWFQFVGGATTRPSWGKINEYYYDQITEITIKGLRAVGASGDLQGIADAMAAAVDGIALRATLDPVAWPAERQDKVLNQLIRPLLKEAGVSTKN